MAWPRRAAIQSGVAPSFAAALTLAGQGVEKVLVVESSAYEQPRIGESIPPDSRHLFAELGLLEAFLAEGHEPCLGSCSSWGADELGYNDFLFNPYGNGWHLDRRRFDAFLADARAGDFTRGNRFRDRGRGVCECYRADSDAEG